MNNKKGYKSFRGSEMGIERRDLGTSENQAILGFWEEREKGANWKRVPSVIYCNWEGKRLTEKKKWAGRT